VLHPDNFSYNIFFAQQKITQHKTSYIINHDGWENPNFKSGKNLKNHHQSRTAQDAEY
jgi:hypothetical protein